MIYEEIKGNEIILRFLHLAFKTQSCESTIYISDYKRNHKPIISCIRILP